MPLYIASTKIFVAFCHKICFFPFEPQRKRFSPFLFSTLEELGEDTESFQQPNPSFWCLLMLHSTKVPYINY